MKRLAAALLAAAGLLWGQADGVHVIGGGGSGSGIVASGTTPRLVYFPSTGSTVQETARLEYDAANAGIQVKDADGDIRTRVNSVFSIFSSNGATETGRWTLDTLAFGSAYRLEFSSTAAWNGTRDVGICRTAAGKIGITDGSGCNADGTLQVASLEVGAGGPLTMPLEFVFYNGGSALAENQTQWLYVSQACTIASWNMGADQSGSVSIDLWVDSHANFPPTNADSITASAQPALSTAQSGSDSTLTGWTTSIAAGSWVRATIEGTPADITQVTLSVQCNRT